MPANTLVPVAEKGVDVVLNGGEKEMDSATIPVQFFLSPEVISQKPKYVVLFEQNGQEAADMKANNLGRRYACKVEDGVKFMQLFSPGYHRLAVLVLGGEISDEIIREQVEVLMNTEGRDRHNLSIRWDLIRSGVAEGSAGSVSLPLAVTMVEFEVPVELFAEKPKTRFGQAVEKWADGFFSSPPRDQCAYRKRVLFSFTLQPMILFVIELFSLLYVLIGFAVAFFCGWKPRNIFSLLRNAVILDFNFDHDSVRQYPSVDGWRVWSRNNQGESTMMLVAPYEVLVAFPLGWISWFLAKGLWQYFAAFSFGEYMTMLLCTGICLMLTWSLVRSISFRVFNFLAGQEHRARWLQKREARIAAEKDRLAQEEEQWLRENLSLSLKPNEVDLAKVPRKSVVQTFRIGYWTLKAKMCKPYPR